MANTHQSATERSNAFMIRVEDLVKEIVLQNNIPVYRIESGLEDNATAGLPYIKIITYFENPISTIEKILSQEFDVAQPAVNNTAPDKFSPRQTILNAALKANRLELAEYKTFGSTKFSIHICSVLHDAWSGIESELGVDGNNLSEEAKRNLYRAGALMETADLEFSKIGDLLIKTQAKTAGTSATPPVNGQPATPVQQAAPAPKPAPAPTPQAASSNGEKNGASQSINLDGPGRLNVNANGVVENAPAPKQPLPNNEDEKQFGTPALDEYAQMTDATLREYASSSKLLKEVDTQIAKQADARLTNEIDIEGDVERLKFLKVFSLKQLNEKLLENKADIVAFADKWIGKDSGGSFEMGIGLFYLEYLLVAKKNDPAFAVEYVLKFISDNEYSARYIVPTYEAIKGAEVDTSVSSKFSHLTLKATPGVTPASSR